MSQLKVQLRDAAEREARRGPVRRAAAAARVNGTRPLLATGALAVLAVCVALAAGALRQPPTQSSAPRIVGDLGLTGGGGYLAQGFGAMWASDPGAGDILRVSPDSGRVLARLHIGGQPHAIVAGDGAVWTYDFGRARLLRIDPSTGRVTARLKLGLPPRGDAGLVVLDGHVWAADFAIALQIDPAGRRIVRRVSLVRGGQEAAGITTNGRSAFVLGRDERLTTLDGRTGARGPAVALQVVPDWLGAAGRAVIAKVAGGFAAVDPASGRTLWQTHVRAKALDGAAVSGATLWVHGTRASGRDAVWRLDAATGRVTGTVALPEFGYNSLQVLGGRLWVLTPGGRLLIVSGG